MHTGSTTTALWWWIGTVVAAGLVLFSAPIPDRTHVTQKTPYDATGTDHAEQWAFLENVGTMVPVGSTLTIQAMDAETEMSLYMMAVGVIPRATVIPNTYYGRPVAESDSARFVATYGAEIADPEGAADTIEIPGGTLTDRKALVP
jgi:hypothetical protein